MSSLETRGEVLWRGDERAWRVGDAIIYKLDGGVDKDSLSVSFDGEGLPVITAFLAGSEGKVRLRHCINLEELQVPTAHIFGESLFDDDAEFIADQEAVWRVQIGSKGEKIFDRVINNRKELGIWRVIEAD